MRTSVDEGDAMAAELRIEVEPYGSDQQVYDRSVASLVADHRLVAFRLVEPARKTARPRPHDRYHAIFYDYTGNRAIHAKGPLGDSGRAEVSVTQRQPR